MDDNVDMDKHADKELSRFKNTLKRAWKIFYKSCSAVVIISIISRYGISLFLNIPTLALILSCIIFVLTIFSYRNFYDYYSKLPANVNACHPSSIQFFFTFLLSIILLITAVPALIIYWLVNPSNIKKGIQIAVFCVVGISGVLYYIKNRDKFPTAADKITYFSALFIAPIS